jgi:hypothetical protein
MRVATTRAQQAELDLMHNTQSIRSRMLGGKPYWKTRRTTECLAAGYLRVHTISQVRGSREDVTALSHITTVSSCDNPICTIVTLAKTDPKPRPVAR